METTIPVEFSRLIWPYYSLLCEGAQLGARAPADAATAVKPSTTSVDLAGKAAAHGTSRHKSIMHISRSPSTSKTDFRSELDFFGFFRNGRHGDGDGHRSFQSVPRVSSDSEVEKVTFPSFRASA